MELFIEKLKDYGMYVIMIVGVIEFGKGVKKDKGFCKCKIVQIILCIVAGITYSLREMQEYSAELFFDICFNSLLFVSLSMLLYDLIIKKIEKAKKE